MEEQTRSQRRAEVRDLKKEGKYKKARPFVTIIPTKTAAKGFDADVDNQPTLFEVIIARRQERWIKHGFTEKDYSYMKVAHIEDPIDEELNVIGSLLRTLQDEEKNERKIIIHASNQETIKCLFENGEKKKKKAETKSRREYYTEDILKSIEQMKRDGEEVTIQRRDW
jgi:hypothetical protein